MKRQKSHLSLTLFNYISVHIFEFCIFFFDSRRLIKNNNNNNVNNKFRAQERDTVRKVRVRVSGRDVERPLNMSFLCGFSNFLIATFLHFSSSPSSIKCRYMCASALRTRIV